MTKSASPPSSATCSTYIQKDRARTEERLRAVLTNARNQLSSANCPFCMSPVHPAASVCATCRRDLPDPATRAARQATVAREALAAWQSEAQRALIREEFVVPELVKLGGTVTEASARFDALASGHPFGGPQEIARRHSALVAMHERDLLALLAIAEQGEADVVGPQSEKAAEDTSARLLRVAPFPIDAYAAEVTRQRRSAWSGALRDSFARLEPDALPAVPESDGPILPPSKEQGLFAHDSWLPQAVAFRDRLNEGATFLPVLEAALAAAAVRFAGRAPPDGRVLLTRMTPPSVARLATVHRIPDADLPAVARTRAAFTAATGEGAAVWAPWPTATRQAVVLAWAAAVVSLVALVVIPATGLAAAMVLVVFSVACAGLAVWMSTAAGAVVDDRAGRAARDAFAAHAREVARGYAGRNREWREGLSAALEGRPVEIEAPGERAALPEPTLRFPPGQPLPSPVPGWARFGIVGTAAVVAGCVALLVSDNRAALAQEAERRLQQEAATREEEARAAAAEQLEAEQARQEEEREAALTRTLDAVVEKGMQAMQPAFDACRGARISNAADTAQPPFLGGRWRVTFIVLATGRTIDTTVTPLGQADPALETCIKDTIANARFPLIVRPVEATRELEFAAPEPGAVASTTGVASATGAASASSAAGAARAAASATREEAPAPAAIDTRSAVRSLADACGRQRPAVEGSRWRVQFQLPDGARARDIRVSNILGEDAGLSACLSAALQGQRFTEDPGTEFSTVLTGGGK